MRGRAVFGVLGMVLLAASCTPSATTPTTVAEAPATSPVTPTTPPSTASATTTSTTTTTSAPTTTTRATGDVGCGHQGGEPWEALARAESRTILETAEGIRVDAVVYPHPDYEGNPWSQWGQGIVLDDGRYLSAIGDHRGADGNSFLYEFDPATGEISMIADVLSLTDHQPGSWGYGKIHAQMVEGACQDIYVTTYWGTRRDLRYTGSYQGDLLLRLDPARRTIENLGVLLPEHGVPSLASWPEGGLLYAEAIDPMVEEKQGQFVVWDMRSGERVFSAPTSHGFRSMAVAPDGDTFVTLDQGVLGRFDTQSRQLSPVAELPGSFLRAATSPDPEGTIYAATTDPPVFFALDPDGGISPIGEAEGYTTSLGFDPSEGTVYSVPHAHGGAWEEGTPLLALDPASGRSEVVARLNAAAEREFGLRLGGTYSVGFDQQRNRVFLGMNAGDADLGESFGEVVLLIVHLP